MSGPYIPLTDERRGLILEAIREGQFRTDAARAGGVSLDKLRSWEAEHPEFAAEMQAAELESTGALIKTIRTGATEDWRAAAWLLERRNSRWRSPEVKLREKQGPAGSNVTVNNNSLTVSADDLRKELAFRVAAVQELEAKPVLTAAEQKLLASYKS